MNSAVGICLLMTACGAAAAACNTAVYESVANDCPATASSKSETIASEPECILHCTLDSECRLSVYVTDSTACYSLRDETPIGLCHSGMIARRKLPPASSPVWLSLTFSAQIVLFYNFRKSFKNLADPSFLFEAEPVNITEQNSIDGVRLQGSSSSYLKVSTPGFYRYFEFGQKFSIFFQGKFSSNSIRKCFGAFVDVSRRNMYSSTLSTDENGRIFAKFFFPRGERLFKQWTSRDALSVDSTQRVASIGINFEGEGFAAQAYLNGSALNRNTWGGGPRKYSGNLFSIHDHLLIGNCMKSEIEPFDGWLQCWALLTGNLDMSQFDQLRSLCNT